MPSLEAAPVLSTPDANIFQGFYSQIDTKQLQRLDDEQLLLTYEIERTVNEIRVGRWKRVALQFPDHMLLDGPRVFQALSRGLKQARKGERRSPPKPVPRNGKELASELDKTHVSGNSDEDEEKLYILADTSYGACCIDEVAAEHADADVVVHYGRSCLSPTVRLPVIYVFTRPPLEVDFVVQSFRNLYTQLDQKVILMADIPYVDYVPKIGAELRNAGYTNIFETSLTHDTASLLPNRTIQPETINNLEALLVCQLFHISDPPPSLLLTLSSRVGSIHIYPTPTSSAATAPTSLPVSSRAALRRRYALLTSLSTVPIFGILINTLSVKNYMHILSHVKSVIAAAGKKSYTFVVGKVNAAKVANFSEVGGWVVIGCWESSLFESKDFWKPVITPFELELALTGDEERIWTGKWTSDFQAVLDGGKEMKYLVNGDGEASSVEASTLEEHGGNDDAGAGEVNSEEESAPPEFDLRTGRYVSHSRPMTSRRRVNSDNPSKSSSSAAQSLIKRTKGDLAKIGGEVSPAAEFMREKRTWKGLGSDFEIKYDEDNAGNVAHAGKSGATMEQGRSGVARGYVVGDDAVRR